MQRSSCPTPKGQLRKGFTLIELIFVMAITSIVFGTAMFLIALPKVEEEIREAHSGIEDLVRRARAMSYSYQQPFVVEFREGEVRLMPLALPEQMNEDELPGGSGQPDALRSLDSMSWPVVYKLDPKYELSLMRWNSRDFLPVTDNEVERWIHQPGTPCEPMAVQLYCEEEAALLSQEYHPLTAKPVDLRMSIGNQ